MHTRVHQEAQRWLKQSTVGIIGASFFTSNPTRQRFVVVKAGRLRADVAVLQP